MRKVLFGLAVAASASASCLVPADDKADPTAGWTSDFSADRDTLTHTGKNPYFVLEPGYQLVFEDGDERVVKTVLDETRVVDGVESGLSAHVRDQNKPLDADPGRAGGVSEFTGPTPPGPCGPAHPG